MHRRSSERPYYSDDFGVMIGAEIRQEDVHDAEIVNLISVEPCSLAGRGHGTHQIWLLN